MDLIDSHQSLTALQVDMLQGKKSSILGKRTRSKSHRAGKKRQRMCTLEEDVTPASPAPPEPQTLQTEERAATPQPWGEANPTPSASQQQERERPAIPQPWGRATEECEGPATPAGPELRKETLHHLIAASQAAQVL